MASFKLSKPYTMDKEAVRAAAQGLVANLEREHGVRSRWEGDSVRITGSGIDGQMSFDNGSIDVSVKMGFMASMFESVLRSEVKRYLDKHVS
jgi:putative polyhydroxyalkanoate system protein